MKVSVHSRSNPYGVQCGVEYCDIVDQPLCQLDDYPGDGYCDDLCDLPDPDCDIIDPPLCDPNDFPGDGVCDALCQLDDLDCDGVTITNDAVLCLELMTAEQPGLFFLSDTAPVAEVTERLQWDVFDTDAFELFGGDTADITFFEAGDFRVQLTVFLLDGTVEISTCEVSVSVSTTP